MASVRSDRSMDRSVRKQYTPITEPVSPGIFPGSGSQDMADRDNAESVDSSSPAAPALHEDIEVLKTVKMMIPEVQCQNTGAIYVPKLLTIS